MAVPAGNDSRGMPERGQMTVELRRLELRALDRVVDAAPAQREGGRDDDTARAPLLAEGTCTHRASPGADELTGLVQELVTPLTVLMAVQQRMIDAVASRGDAVLLEELRWYSDRGHDAMASIHRVLAELRGRL